MAENIFTDSDYNQIVRRLHQLTQESKRKWGKMSLPQMLEHCAIQLKLALGKIPPGKAESSFIYRTTAGRWLSLYIIPWPHGFETPSKMNMLKNHVPVKNYEAEREQLLTLLAEVRQRSSLMPHPFYDKMSQKDWGRLIWKNINHHLKQFSQ
jgi:hypothetical protein